MFQGSSVAVVTDYSTHIVNSPVLLFLGAGASVPLKKPQMNQFLNIVQQKLDHRAASILARVRRERNDDLEEVMEDLEAMLRLHYVQNFMTSGASSSGLLPPPPDIAAQVGDNEIFQLGVQHARKALEQEVIHTYGSVPDESVRAVYSPLFQVLFDEAKTQTIPVFTTNYDRAIERFSELAGKSYELVYGFRTTGSRAPTWDRGVFDEYAPRPVIRSIVLFKLHGSVDWIYDSATNEVTLAVPLYASAGGERFHNAVIYPAMRKIATSEPFSTAYDYFQRCCEGGKILVVIGYSFRDYDALTRLRSALSVNPRLRLVLLAPGASGLLKTLGLPSDRCRPIDGHFGNTEVVGEIAKEVRAAGLVVSVS